MKIDGEISQEDFKREYSALCEIKNKHIEIKNSYIEKEIDDNEKLRQVSIIREIINTNSNPLTEFDDSIFKAIVDKVIVRTPVSFSFVLINGMEFAIDGREAMVASSRQEDTKRRKPPKWRFSLYLSYFLSSRHSSTQHSTVLPFSHKSFLISRPSR